MSPRIYFFYDNVKPGLRDRTLLKKHIESLFRREGVRLSQLNYVFCTDDRLLEINRQYLQHDYYTDIITFDLAGKGEPVNGEVYISLDRVRDNARALGVPLRQELRRVIFHGALHLCGYKDKTEKEKEKMREREEFYLLRS